MDCGQLDGGPGEVSAGPTLGKGKDRSAEQVGNAVTYCVSCAWTWKRESSSEPAALVAAATLLCSRFIRAAVAAFLKASCSAKPYLSHWQSGQWVSCLRVAVTRMEMPAVHPGCKMHHH